MPIRLVRLCFVSGLFLLLILVGDNKPVTTSLAAHSVENSGAKDYSGDNYGGADVNVITQEGDSDFPKVTQAESVVWANGNTVVVVYNDTKDAPAPYQGTVMGVSYSLDGGTTFTRVRPSPFTGHGNNFGDPILVYNAIRQEWFVGAMVSGCDGGGGNGWGLGLWTSSDGTTWVPGACAHNNNVLPDQDAGDDRPSMWVDNNPGSPYPGRMYISWNDFTYTPFNPGISVTHSDNGDDWSAPSRLEPIEASNIQITGSRGTDGRVFVVGLDPSVAGKYPSSRNYIWRSTDGGDNWTQLNLGTAEFRAITSKVCGAAGIPNVWRYKGLGQPGVGPNNVVHYAWGAGGENPGDIADILYIRSTDNGNTWSAPRRLDSDVPNEDNKAQWMPSLAVTDQGVVLVSWYDRRNVGNGYNYQFMGRLSTDNGQTWGAIEPISDPGPPEYIPEPIQPDGIINPCFGGDYNYHTAQGNNIYVTWTDGRRRLLNQQGTPVPQMDVFFDKVTIGGGPTPTPTPTPCSNPGNYTIASYTNGSIYQADTLVFGGPGRAAVPIPFPSGFNFTLYDQTFTGATASTNGVLEFVGSNTREPNMSDPQSPDYECLHLPPTDFSYSIMPYWAQLNINNNPSAPYHCTASYPCGIYISTESTQSGRIFHIIWKACQLGVQAAKTKPGGEIPYCGQDNSAYIQFEVKLYEGRSYFETSYGAGDTNSFQGREAVIGVQKPDGGKYTFFSCDVDFGATNRLTFTLCSLPPTPTNTPTRTPTRTMTPTNIPTPTPCPNPELCGQFADVPQNYEFYPYIQCLSCRSIVGGYPCGGPGERCECGDLPYFRPSANVTRGQISQMTSRAAGFVEPPGPQIFEDVPPANDFYEDINRLANRGIVTGYPCNPGGASEPCVPPENRPYFRPNTPATRGQIAKIVSGAAGYNEDPTTQTFEDVPSWSDFYKPIERLAARGIANGYPCTLGGTTEPCVPPNNRPYFRPGNNATRGQASKMVSRTFYPECNPPNPPAKPGSKPVIPATIPATVPPATNTPASTPMNTPASTPTNTPLHIPSPWPTVPLPIPTGVYIPTIPPISTVPGTIPVSSVVPSGTVLSP